MSMNIFRLAGDLSHVAAIFLLIWQLQTARNARGISLKTQELYLLVFMTRYLDLFTTYYSFYNSALKILFLGTTLYTICLIRYWDPIKSLYNHSQDCFPHVLLAILPSALLAFLILLHRYVLANRSFMWMELLWTFSVVLESIAILPQLTTLRKYGLVENLTGSFVLLLGLYRFLYIFNWVYRTYTEKWYYQTYARHNLIVYISGIVQVLMYLDFFIQYMRASARTRDCSARQDGLNNSEIVDPEDTNERNDQTEDLLFEFSHRQDRGELNNPGAKEKMLSQRREPIVENL